VVKALNACSAGGFKHCERPEQVGLHEGCGSVDRPVDVALGSEVHDGVGLVLREDCAECGGIAEIDMFEGVVRIAFKIGERLGITGIAQLIEVDDGFALLFNEQTNEIGSDEAGSAGD
jgi:hypothetical protein